MAVGQGLVASGQRQVAVLQGPVAVGQGLAKNRPGPVRPELLIVGLGLVVVGLGLDYELVEWARVRLRALISTLGKKMPAWCDHVTAPATQPPPPPPLSPMSAGTN